MDKWQSIIIDVIRDFFEKNSIKYSKDHGISILLARYYNFRLKYIDIKRWNVRVSKELSAILEQHPKREDCFEIFRKAHSGENLNPFQSKTLRNADYHDGLFNDWGIHHLHLNAQKKSTKDFFTDRSGDLIFAKFENNTTMAYFINIYKHTEDNLWSLKEAIQILQNNWPNLMKPYQTGNNFTPDFNDEEIGILRRKGYSFGINVDGQSYISLGHGYTSSGDNSAALGESGEVIRWGYKNRIMAEVDEQAFRLALCELLWLEAS